MVHELPDYMKICYRSLLNLVDEFAEEMTKQGRSYSTHFLKEAVWNSNAFAFFNYYYFFNDAR